MPNQRQYNKERRITKRVIKLVVGYYERNRSNGHPDISSNERDPEPTAVDIDADTTYNSAINYFISSAIQTVNKGYTATTDLSEFIVENVINFLWWMKLYRWFFIIEKTIIILKLISDIII